MIQISLVRRRIFTTSRMLIFVLLVMTPNTATAVDTGRWTVQDILDGIKMRQSKVRDIDLQYVVEDVKSAAFYSKQKQIAVANKRNDVISNIDQIPHASSQAFRLEAHGDNVAFAMFTIDHGSRALLLKGVYENGIRKIFEPAGHRGSIEEMRRSAVIWFPTIPRMLGVEGVELEQYLRSAGIISLVEGARVDPTGDLLVRLKTTRIYTPNLKRPSIEIVTEYLIDVDVTRDFWPVSVLCRHILEDTSSGRSVDGITRKVSVQSFFRDGGLYYPKSFECVNMDPQVIYEGRNPIPKVVGDRVLETTKVHVQHLSVNRGISDSAFHLTFPDGTAVNDSITGLTQTVGAPVEYLKKQMEASLNALSASKYSKSDATEIMKARGQTGREWGNTGDVADALPSSLGPPVKVPVRHRELLWYYGVYVLVAIACGAAAYASIAYVRKMRRRR